MWSGLRVLDQVSNTVQFMPKLVLAYHSRGRLHKFSLLSFFIEFFNLLGTLLIIWQSLFSAAFLMQIKWTEITIGKKNSLCSLMFPRNNLNTGKAGNRLVFLSATIYTSGLLPLKALLPTAVTMGGPSLTELVSGITEKCPSQSSFPAWGQAQPSWQFPCVLLRRGLSWLSDWILPAKQDWDHYIKMLQGQKQICNYCDITLSSQCFSRLFIAFRLWHQRWGGRGLTCSLTLHGYNSHTTWLFWKMAAHSGQVETRTHLVSPRRLEMPFRCGGNVPRRGASIRPVTIMAPSSSAIHQHCRGDGRNPHLPFRTGNSTWLLWWVRLFLEGCQALWKQEALIKWWQIISIISTRSQG